MSRGYKLKLSILSLICIWCPDVLYLRCGSRLIIRQSGDENNSGAREAPLRFFGSFYLFCGWERLFLRLALLNEAENKPYNND